MNRAKEILDLINKRDFVEDINEIYKISFDVVSEVLDLIDKLEEAQTVMYNINNDFLEAAKAGKDKLISFRKNLEKAFKDLQNIIPKLLKLLDKAIKEAEK